MATGSLSVSPPSDQSSVPVRSIEHEMRLAASEARLVARGCEKLLTAEGLGKTPTDADFDNLRYHLQTALQAVSDAQAAVASPAPPPLTLRDARTRVEICRNNLAVIREQQAEGFRVCPRLVAFQERKLREAQDVIDAAKAAPRRRAS